MADSKRHKELRRRAAASDVAGIYDLAFTTMDRASRRSRQRIRRATQSVRELDLTELQRQADEIEAAEAEDAAEAVG